MSQTPKKQNFLHGAMLLTIATAIVKVIGALYKIPLKMVIGDQGYGYFVTAYDIYTVLLMISTAGLPIAMSRMISQATALNHNNQVRRIYKTSRAIFLALGIASTALMMIFCHELAQFQGQPDAWAAIACLGPCALLMGIMSTYRGFSQGQGDMRPTSNSQMLEAVVKLIVGLAAAFAVMYFTNSVALAAGGAILGVTVSCMASVFYLYAKFLPAYNQLPSSNDEPLSWGATAKSLLAIAVPITIGSAGLQILTVIETNLYMGQLRSALDATMSSGSLETWLTAYGYEGEALARADAIQFLMDTRKGIYNMAQTIFNMPCAFIIPITTSIIPALTAHLTLNNHGAVKTTEESSARITSLISLPCAVGLMVLARPVMGLLGGYSGEKLELAAQLMGLLSLSIFFYSTIQLTNALLQSHGQAHIPVINMLVGGILKLAVVYVLTGNPELGILGAPIGMMVCYLAIAVFNILALYRTVSDRPALISNFLRSLPPAVIMGVCVFGCYFCLTEVLHITSNVILCGAPIAVGVAVYVVCVSLFKSITREDCILLPKGEKIADLLRL